MAPDGGSALRVTAIGYQEVIAASEPTLLPLKENPSEVRCRASFPMKGSNYSSCVLTGQLIRPRTRRSCCKSPALGRGTAVRARHGAIYPSFGIGWDRTPDATAERSCRRQKLTIGLADSSKTLRWEFLPLKQR